MKFVIAIIILAVGVLLAFKPNWLMAMTGRVAWIENHVFVMYGGTAVFYRLLGAFFILLSLVVAFGRIKLGFLGRVF